MYIITFWTMWYCLLHSIRLLLFKLKHSIHFHKPCPVGFAKRAECKAGTVWSKSAPWNNGSTEAALSLCCTKFPLCITSHSPHASRGVHSKPLLSIPEANTLKFCVVTKRHLCLVLNILPDIMMIHFWLFWTIPMMCEWFQRTVSLYWADSAK